MLRPFFDDMRMSLLRYNIIRIPQNLGNKFTHAFATCTRPSRLGLEFEAWFSPEKLVLLNSRELLQVYL